MPGFFRFFPGEISAEVSGHYSHTWGHSETKTTTETHTFLCPAPPYKKVVCKAVVHSRQVDEVSRKFCYKYLVILK